MNKMMFVTSFTQCFGAVVKYANKKLGTSNTSKDSMHKCSKPLFVFAVVG